VASYPQYIALSAGVANSYQGCYDGYSMWIPTFYGASKTLIRLRASDGAYLKSDLTVGATLADATINTAQGLISICTDGTHFWAGNVGVQVGGVIGGGYWSGGTKAVFAGGYAFIPSADARIHRVSSAGAYAQLAIPNSTRIAFDGTNIWVATNGSGLIKAALDGTILATYIGAGAIIGEVECAGTDVWVYYSTKLTRIRGSDGAWLDANGNVSATEVTYSIGDTGSVQAMCWDGEDMWLTAGSSASTANRVSRMRGSNGVHVETLAPLYGACSGAIRAGNNLWFVTGPSQYTPATAWRYTAFLTPVTPALTAVDPGVGPHLSLTFDNPVGITGPTIGGPSDGLGVTGVTQISTTQIDLACAIRPDHPTGQADTHTLAPPIGEADNLGPPIPTGIGAIVI
jgi:hypothetical protein